MQYAGFALLFAFYSGEMIRFFMQSLYVVSIYQGTNFSKVILFNKDMKIIDYAVKEHDQIQSNLGWIEHNAEQIWINVKDCLEEICLRNSLSEENVKAVGITN